MTIFNELDYIACSTLYVKKWSKKHERNYASNSRVLSMKFIILMPSMQHVPDYYAAQNRLRSIE